MSSVTRFIRQVQTPYFSATTVQGTPASYAYEFQASAANVVGNYPPGFMTTASAALQAAITAAGANSVLRDMGKTVQAPVGSLTGNTGFFRQVQLLAPTEVTAAQGYTGGLAGNNFGVLGAANTPDSYTDYLVFYIPITVGGVNADMAHSVTHSAFGQM